MTDRVLERKEAISKYCEEIATCHLCLKWQEIDVFESVKSAFGRLDEFTDALSAEAEVTALAINTILHIFETDVLVIDEF